MLLVEKQVFFWLETALFCKNTGINEIKVFLELIYMFDETIDVPILSC